MKAVKQWSVIVSWRFVWQLTWSVVQREGGRLKVLCQVETKRPHAISLEDYSFMKRPFRRMKLAETGGSRSQPI